MDIKPSVTKILKLEYLGVRFEKQKEEHGLRPKVAYYYSVPELSTLEVDNKELNTIIKTAHGLKYLAKEILIDIFLDFFKDKDPEFVADVKNNIHDYFKFYAKVRTGEVWNKELAEQRIKDLERQVQEVTSYKEI